MPAGDEGQATIVEDIAWTMGDRVRDMSILAGREDDAEARPVANQKLDLHLTAFCFVETPTECSALPQPS